jgi:WS/DGAT/MGAT family acyltransferase
MSKERQLLSSVDAALLGMEDSTNLMMVAGVMLFKRPLEMEKLKAVLASRLLPFERFRQRIIFPRLPLLRPYWELDPHFNLNAHLHRLALPQPGDRLALERMLSDLVSTPFDFTKPLWHFHLVEGYEEGCALIVRMHHAIADGMSLVSLFMAVADMHPNAPISLDEQVKSNGYRPIGPMTQLVEQMDYAAGRTRHVVGRLVNAGQVLLDEPEKWQAYQRKGVEFGVAGIRILVRHTDRGLLQGQPGVRKAVAWTDPVEMADVKLIRQAWGGTVNDVMLATLTGALRRYFLAHNQPMDEQLFSAVVPVNIRPPDRMAELGNQFGVVFVKLPLAEADPHLRLSVIHYQMDELKGSAEVDVTFNFFRLLGLMPPGMQSPLIRLLATRATAVVSNVPGPRMPLYLAGEPIDQFIFWAPQSGRVGMSITIMSYQGRVMVGVAGDAGLMAQPELVMHYFQEEFCEMKQLAVGNGRLS